MCNMFSMEEERKTVVNTQKWKTVETVRQEEKKGRDESGGDWFWQEPLVGFIGRGLNSDSKKKKWKNNE